MIDFPEDEKLFETLIFLLKLLFLSAPLYFILQWGNLVPLQGFVSEKVVEFLRFTGYPAVRRGTTIILGKGSFSITEDCTGWKSLIFMVALVVATKSKLTNKIKALSLNLPILFSINLTRVSLLIILTSSLGVESYGLMHDFFWQISTAASVLLLWFIWVRRESLIIKD